MVSQRNHSTYFNKPINRSEEGKITLAFLKTKLLNKKKTFREMEGF